MARTPILAPSSTVLLLPMRHSSPRSARVHEAEMPDGGARARPPRRATGVTWITAQSCTFAPRRITIGEKSARITVLYQTEAFSSTVTSPMMEAVGAMNAVG